MRSYIVTCCSTVDLSRQQMEELGIPYVSFHYYMDDKDYLDDLYQSTTPEAFFRMIEEGAQPVTSQLSPEEYMEFWRPYLEEGRDILHITLSSGISGTFGSANLAKNLILEEYPDRQIEVVDSLAASSGYGMLVVSARENQLAGMSLSDNLAWIMDHRNQLHHWFFSTDLTSYIRGGRVSKVSGFFGQMLNICPLLNVNCEGKLIPREKCRGKKKVIRTIFSRMQDHAQDGAHYHGKVYMSHSASQAEAEAVAALVREAYPEMEGEIIINPIGTVIGSHTGPGTVALFFWGDERTE